MVVAFKISGKGKEVDEVGEGALGDGVLDREIERMRWAGVGSLRCPSESAGEDACDACLVMARKGRAAALCCSRVALASGSSACGVSSGVVPSPVHRLNMDGFQDGNGY